MSDPAAPSDVRYTVLLTDGRSFGPADRVLLAQWARDGRIPAEAFIQGSDGAPPIRASDMPDLRAVYSAPPSVAGPLASPAGTGADGGLSYIIPFRNGWALAAYYVGIFSLIPIFGIILGPLAIIFGCLGLRHASRHANAHGRVHAIVGVILGSLVVIGHGVFFVMISKMKL